MSSKETRVMEMSNLAYLLILLFQLGIFSYFMEMQGINEELLLDDYTFVFLFKSIYLHNDAG